MPPRPRPPTPSTSSVCNPAGGVSPPSRLTAPGAQQLGGDDLVGDLGFVLSGLHRDGGSAWVGPTLIIYGLNLVPRSRVRNWNAMIRSPRSIIRVRYGVLPTRPAGAGSVGVVAAARPVLPAGPRW
jgi:hypothetical protein